DLGALRRRNAGAQRRDLAALGDDGADLVAPARRVEEPCVGECGERHQLVARGWVEAASLRQAMRTATPNSTWSRIRLRSISSATSESISTPRFIGPGCITSASGLAAVSRSAVRPWK